MGYNPTIKSLASILTTQRSTTGTCINAAGQIVSAAIDTPRIDWTDGAAALLVEASSTNYVLRSSHTAGSPWSDGVSANGVTATIVGTGMAGAVPYADYAVTGAATSTTASPFVSTAYSITPAAAGEVWSASCYVQLISGSWPSGGVAMQCGVYELDGSNAFLRGTGNNLVPAAGAARMVTTRSLTGPNLIYVRSSVQLAGLTAGVTTFSGQVVRIYGWQLEKTSAASSLIQTLGGVAVTRAADLCTVDAASLGLSAGFTLAVKGVLAGPGTSASPTVLSVDAGSSAERSAVYFDTASGQLKGETYAGSAFQGVSGGVAYTLGNPFAIAYRAGANNARLAANGSLQALDSVVTLPAAPTTIRLGRSTGGTVIGRARLKSILLYPALLSDADLTILGTV
jgi:hypothetical protein